jgi:hypothetical protein
MRSKYQTPQLFHLNFTVSVNWNDREPVILVVVSVKVLPLDGHLAEHFVLLQVAIPIVHVYREVPEPPRHLKLELLAKKWAANKSDLLKTKHISVTINETAQHSLR